MSEESGVRCHVRAMVESDLQQVLAWRNSPDVRRYMFGQSIISASEHGLWFERAKRDPYQYLFIFEVGGTPLGFVGFTRSRDGAIADWSFHISPNAPKGSGRQLGQAALDYCFGVLKFHKVCGRVLAYNERSINLHKRLGFQLEGVLREQYFDGHAYLGIHCFGLLSHEWHVEKGSNLYGSDITK